jgi:hypothetical protein
MYLLKGLIRIPISTVVIKAITGQIATWFDVVLNNFNTARPFNGKIDKFTQYQEWLLSSDRTSYLTVNRGQYRPVNHSAIHSIEPSARAMRPNTHKLSYHQPF